MRVFFIIIAAILSGCAGSSKEAREEVRSGIWRTIFFDFGSEELTVYNDGDSLVLRSWVYKDSLTETGKVRLPAKFTTKREPVEPTEEDSIYTWTTRLTYPPVMPTKFCTDYVGSLKVKIQFGERVFQTSEFYSICDWELLSPETQKLHALFKEKFPALR